MYNNDFESHILCFERIWRENGPCDICRFLNALPALNLGERGRLLMELVCIDLEFRWRGYSGGHPSHERRLLETYVTNHPELGPFARLSLDLIGQEYRVRCQWGDQPIHLDVLSRFPARWAEIRAELARIDSELRGEAAVTRGAMFPSAEPSALEVVSGLELPFLSHQDILLQRMIGSGATGKVYEAWQKSVSRLVAVKFLRKSFLHEPMIVHRFVREAEIITRLRHPNIVGIHGLGRTPAGAYFLIMELVTGPNLDSAIRTSSIPVVVAVRWVMEACKALEYAHSQGIIHCDLKPANLLLDQTGRLIVTDFGLARSLTEDTPWTTEVEGTAPYMAPEQASRAWGQIDERTDVYGIGAVLFALLTGRPPWEGRRLPDILADVISSSPVISPRTLRSDLPEALSDVCRKCFSKFQSERYHTVHEFRSALDGIIGSIH